MRVSVFSQAWPSTVIRFGQQEGKSAEKQKEPVKDEEEGKKIIGIDVVGVTSSGACVGAMSQFLRVSDSSKNTHTEITFQEYIKPLAQGAGVGAGIFLCASLLTAGLLKIMRMAAHQLRLRAYEKIKQAAAKAAQKETKTAQPQETKSAQP